MLRSGLTILWICLAIGLHAQTVESVNIGAKIDNFRLSDDSGNRHTLKTYAGKITVFVFWSYKCPSSIRYTDRLDVLQRKYDNSRVAVVGIFAGGNEDTTAILANKSNLGIHFPMLLDPQGQLISMFGATHIPSVFIVDENARLRYRGAIDNDKQIGERKRTAYAEDAIEALLSGSSPAVPETEAKGCIIRP